MPRKSAIKLFIVSQVITDEEILDKKWTHNLLTKPTGEASKLYNLEFLPKMP